MTMVFPLPEGHYTRLRSGRRSSSIDAFRLRILRGAPGKAGVENVTGTAEVEGGGKITRPMTWQQWLA